MKRYLFTKSTHPLLWPEGQSIEEFLLRNKLKLSDVADVEWASSKRVATMQRELRALVDSGTDPRKLISGLINDLMEITGLARTK